MTKHKSVAFLSRFNKWGVPAGMCTMSPVTQGTFAAVFQRLATYLTGCGHCWPNNGSTGQSADRPQLLLGRTRLQERGPGRSRS